MRRPLARRQVVRSVLAVAGLAALVGAPAPARAQEDPAPAAPVDSRALISEAGARAAALRLFTAGSEPLLPGLTADEVEVGEREVVEAAYYGPTRGAWARDCGVTIDHAGLLACFSRTAAQFVFDGVATPEGGWTPEALEAFFRAPSHLTEAQAVAAARAFFVDRYPPFTERRWRLADVRHQARYLEWFVAFTEEPAPGVLACYPNRISVYLNAATGLVTRAFGGNVTATVTAPPPVDAAAARAIVERELPRHRVEGATLSLLLKRREPRVVWRVTLRTGFVVVDAVEGQLLVPVED